MTPKEKAKELVESFSMRCSGNSQTALNIDLAKQCAIIVISEKRETLCRYANKTTGQIEQFRNHFDDLMEVKEEINKL
tara:strand:+ start:61 stop:294 length:234 start_codon:yes stop_codon:yes gene_type:complete